MQKLVECVPNFSDGRNPDVYHAIAGVISDVPGVKLLNLSPDAAHNRTVITFVGTPESVEEAAFRAIGLAAQQINLEYHSGEHPRIGATDVCPFIPVRGVTMKECVAIARRLAKRVGKELGIAVYLYGEAATRPERTRLADIRRGQYEKWRDEVATNPERQPDYGPAEPQTWGATVIGARPFLIAYNLYLNSSDVNIADKIARAIRYSSGGLRFVQAKGFLVDGLAQVSMNLTNYERTPIYRVQEMVRREAAHYGLTITKAELVGLAPQQALMESARWYLQLDELPDEQILEYRLYQQDDDVTQSVVDFVQAAAMAEPTPGGGAVAALAGSLGAALTQMVAGLTVGRKKYATVASEVETILMEASRARQILTEEIEADVQAFNAVMAVWRNKYDNEAAKNAALEKATIGAGEVPLRVARFSRDVAKLAQQIVTIGNVNAVTDAAAGAIMARAAAEAAALNVKINAVNLQDRALAQVWREEATTLVAEVTDITQAVIQTAAQRGGF